MKVLVAFEYSGRVRDAFVKQGHQAVSCDIIPTESAGVHVQMDMWQNGKIVLPSGEWDILIAHPPCTYLCNSGIRWLYEQPGRWDKMLDAANLFKALLDVNIPAIAVENPVMHKHAKIKKCDFSIQPWQFGHGEVKRTCFWTKNLPPLKPTNIVAGRYPRTYLMSGKDRGKKRSLTYQGIADAMAAQWNDPKLFYSQPRLV